MDQIEPLEGAGTDAQRILLLDSGSNLLNDIFRRVIEKQADFNIIAEVGRLDDLGELGEGARTDWVIHLVNSQGRKFEGYQLLEYFQPTTRLMTIGFDGGGISVSRLGVSREELNQEMSLEELIKVLKGAPLAGRSAD